MREAAAGVGIGASKEPPGQTLGEVLEAYITHIAKNARSGKTHSVEPALAEMASLREQEVGSIAERDLVEVINGIAAGGTPHAASSFVPRPVGPGMRGAG